MKKRLYKSGSNKIISGVCGGVAEYFDIDPSLVRVGLVILCALTAGFPMVIGYLICACIIPHEKDVK
ncbi:MAG: PspC domain-containing protein [Oscillospiraceae bacterium]|nr:PspC domain-containing protein [Oscillospiraceae bacterium]